LFYLHAALIFNRLCNLLNLCRICCELHELERLFIFAQNNEMESLWAGCFIPILTSFVERYYQGALSMHPRELVNIYFHLAIEFLIVELN